jgi:hypothetical protein
MEHIKQGLLTIWKIKYIYAFCPGTGASMYRAGERINEVFRLDIFTFSVIIFYTEGE